jgi:hypothetical protein
MKKLIFLIFFVLLIRVAEAKTILYVTNTSTDTPCSSLQAADSLYCNRLASLGYTIKVINELHVKDNSSTWNEYANSADMIFLGSNSQSMADKSKYQNAFCGNISSKNKPLFLTYVNTWNSKNISGCAFYPSINLVTANFSDNKCSSKAFKVARTGFITEGFGIDENITIYPSPKVAKIYDISNGGWITAECVPPNGTIDFYPVLFTSNQGVFWGLDEPSSFSNATWDIFDRTIWYMMNDTAWSINAFALPSTATVSQDFWVFANVTQNGKAVTGTVNFTADGSTGSMSYDGLWKSTLRLGEARQYNLNITAYSKSLRGSLSLPVKVGSSIVNITSGNFKPNSNYAVSAKIPEAISASYRMLNPLTYDVILSGNLNCENNICSGNVESMPDLSSLLLEVTTSDGGAFKTITKETLSTDKNIYKPGEAMKIDFFTTDPLTQVNLTIIRPDGTKEIPSPLQMDKISTNHWNKNYTLGENSYNGTWVIIVKTIKGEYNKSIDVVAWNPFAYLNKNVFNVFENLFLTVGTTESYSSNLDIFVSTEVARPDGSIALLGNSTVKGNSNYNFSYVIPRGYPSGVSTVKIKFKDSNNRSSILYLNFSTNITLLQPSLFVTPSTISITTVPGRTLESTVGIENTARINATNIITNVSGLDATVSGPSFLGAGDKTEVKIRINTSSLAEGTYSGKISFYSQVGDTEVTVSLDIIGDLSSQASEKYAELASLESNLTYLNKVWINTTDALKLLNETRDVLNETIKEYKSGNYASAKAKFEEASAKVTELETTISGFYQKLPDYSFLIWDFAIAVVVIIITVTIIKIKGRKKRQKAAKKQVPKEEPKKEEVYFEPKGGEYRTEYY